MHRILDGDSKHIKYEDKAHSAEITDIRVCRDEETTLVATCARDRIVQLFRRRTDGWELVQTFEEHKASVTGVLFIDEGAYLLSCAGDRTVAVRKLVKRGGGEDADKTIDLAYIPHRTLTLKSAPVSMTSYGESVFVSTTDRTVYEFDFLSGRCIRSFRAVDTDGMDAVIMDKLAVLKTEDGSGVLVAGVSSTDKSIRIYDVRGNLVCREWGHTEGVTGLAVLVSSSSEDTPTDREKKPILEEDRTQTMLISTGADGTIMLWDLTRGSSRPSLSTTNDGDSSSLEHKQELLSTKKPMRKVLSRTELAQFQKAASYFSTTSTISSSSVMTSGSGGDAGGPSTTKANNSGYSTMPRTLRGKSSRLGLNNGSGISTPTPSKHNGTVNNQGEDIHTPTRITNNHPFGATPPISLRKGGGGATATDAGRNNNNRPGIHPRTRTKSTGNISSSRRTSSESQPLTPAIPSHTPVVTSPHGLEASSISFSNPFSSGNEKHKESLEGMTEGLVERLRTWREIFMTRGSFSSVPENEGMVFERLQTEMQLTLKEMRRKGVGNNGGTREREKGQERRDDDNDKEVDERNLKVLLDPEALSEERSRDERRGRGEARDGVEEEQEEENKTDIILPRRPTEWNNDRHYHNTDSGVDGGNRSGVENGSGIGTGNNSADPPGITSSRLSSQEEEEEEDDRRATTEKLLREYSDRLIDLVQHKLQEPTTPSYQQRHHHHQP